MFSELAVVILFFWRNLSILHVVECIDTKISFIQNIFLPVCYCLWDLYWYPLFIPDSGYLDLPFFLIVLVWGLFSWSWQRVSFCFPEFIHFTDFCSFLIFSFLILWVELAFLFLTLRWKFGLIFFFFFI